MALSRLGRRHIRDGDYRTALARARAHVTDSQLDDLIAATLADIIAVARAARLGYAWSGGKNSQALAYLMARAGIHTSVLCHSADLEWPAMAQWTAVTKPLGCETVTVPVGVAWLAAHPQLLFPQGRHGTRWAQLHQQAMARWFHREALDVVAVGRRKVDGNWTGPPGTDRYTTAHGVTVWSPLSRWSHEQLFALLEREGLALPPCYRWPRGFQVGTGPWPARQWTDSVDHGFDECWRIDPAVIRRAAAALPAAADWMRRTGRT